jgi:hypothetical protein
MVLGSALMTELTPPETWAFPYSVHISSRDLIPSAARLDQSSCHNASNNLNSGARANGAEAPSSSCEVRYEIVSKTSTAWPEEWMYDSMTHDFAAQRLDISNRGTISIRRRLSSIVAPVDEHAFAS